MSHTVAGTRSAADARCARRIAAALLVIAAMVGGGGEARAQGDTAGVLIRARVERQGTLSAGGEELHSPAAVRQFYASAAYRPAWSAPTAALPVAGAMAAFVDGITSDGLEPDDYHARPLRRLLDERRRRLSPEDRAELDLLLTDAFLSIGHDLVAGRVPPRAVHPAWTTPGRDADLPAALAQALRSGRIAGALVAQRPQTAQYGRLRQALARYRQVVQQGGWPSLSTRTLHPGDEGDEIGVLRARLAAEAAVPGDAGVVTYDSAMVEVVKGFQRRFGYSDDGVVGPATRAALNVAAEKRVEQLRASLERERWLPAALGDRFVAVFIPAFELRAIEDGEVALESRVIAGKDDWRTPIFGAAMTTVVFNPYWNIPPSILAREVLPRQRRDPSYFAREGIEAVRDGAGVRYRQVPGARNPLGEVKFLFPNPYNVYLHDTSSPSLFQRDERAFSHGCVRVEKPLELAMWALARNGWSRDSVEAVAGREKERGVALAAPIPVYIFYRTAWVDDAGAVQFRRDLYESDEQLLHALVSRTPSAARAAREKPAEEDGP
ncbi:MAG TPA: L,D-transpeptidase family protein [Longimicrobium sp.]